MGFFSLTSDWCRLRLPLFPRGFGRGGGGFLLGGRGGGGSVLIGMFQRLFVLQL